jgi:hypothetical protein
MVLLMRGKVEGRLFNAREVEHSALGKLPIHSVLNESELSHSLTLPPQEGTKSFGYLRQCFHSFVILTLFSNVYTMQN